MLITCMVYLKHHQINHYQFSQFCEFITVPWLKHLVGSIVRVLIDYMDYVPLCTKLKSALEVQREWPEIRQIIGKNESFLDFKFSLFTVHMCGCECD